MSVKVLSIGLRLFTLFIKFIFILFLAKYFPPEDVGRFGYITAAVGYLIYFVGFEFYTFSCRELIKSNRDGFFSIITNQLIFYFIIYVVVLPAIIIYLYYKGFSASFIFLFCAITCLEHLAQEVNRILITLRKNLLASIVLFIRGASWCILVIIVVIINPGISDVTTILYFWLTGCFIALCFSVYHLLDFYSKVEFNSDWIKRGVISAIPLFLATLAFRGINTFDRFAIGYISNLGIAGAYVIYSSIGNAIISAIDAAIVSFLYPHVLLAAHERNYENYKAVMKKLFIGLTSITIMSLSGVIFIIPLLLDGMNNIVYNENIYLLKWTLLVAIVNIMAIPPHLGLYAFGYDKPIMSSQIFSFLIFLFLCGITIFAKLDVFYIMISILISFSFSTIYKWYSYFSMISIIKWR